MSVDSFDLNDPDSSTPQSSCSTPSSVLGSKKFIDVERLEKPRVSLFNENTYRVIRLQNGLLAVLISSPGDADETDKPSVSDDSSIRSNVSTDSTKAYCSLSIDIGTFHNPSHLPGLVEATAEMVSRGSVKYPKDNNLASLMSYFQGWYDVIIEGETTTYEIGEIPHEGLHKVLDRVAHLFIEPLMNKDNVANIVYSVGHDYIIRSCSESIKNRFLRNIAVHGHPLVKLTDEHYERVLRLNTDWMYHEILKFRERHYSANRMILVLKSRHPVPTMEEYVFEYFSDIVNNDLPPEDLSVFNGIDPFDPLKFRRMFKMKTSSSNDNLTLSWPMPPLIQNYKTKPHCYLASLITRDDKGSLLYYLRKKGLCTKIKTYAECRYDGYLHNNSMYQLFEVKLFLTKKGWADWKLVLDIFFSYASHIRHTGPGVRYFYDLKNREEMRFRVSKERGKYKHHDMLYYRAYDFLTATSLYFEYSAQAITSCIDCWTPDRMNLILHEKCDHEDELIYEEWCLDHYTGTEISPEWIRNWSLMEPLQDFRSPPPNNLIVTDFSTKLILDENPPYPIEIYSDEYIEVLWKPIMQKALNDSYINCHWISPLPFASAANMAMLDVFLRILNDLFDDHFIMAKDAGYSYKLSSNYKGIWVEINGLSQNLPLFLLNICEYLIECPSHITEEMFNVQKQLYTNRDLFELVSNVCGMISRSIKRNVHWSLIDKQKALRDVKFAEFQDFIEQYLAQLRVCLLVQGEVTKAEAIRAAEDAVGILKFIPVSKNDIPQREELFLPRGVRVCRIKNPSRNNLSTYVENVYQFKDRKHNFGTILDAFPLIMRSEILSEGNDKFRLIDSFFCHSGYTVQAYSPDTPAADTVEAVDENIEEFRRRLNERFSSCREGVMIALKETLIHKKIEQKTFKHLCAEVEYNWKLITSGDRDFDRLDKQIKVLKDISTDNLRAFLMRLLMPASDQRLGKISIQIDSFDPAVSHDPDCDMQDYSLEFLSPKMPAWRMLRSDYFITDIEDFKRDLEVYRKIESEE